MLCTLRTLPLAGASRSRCPRHRKRESRHHVSGCKSLRSRLQKRFVVRADEMLAAFLEIKSAVEPFSAFSFL